MNYLIDPQYTYYKPFEVQNNGQNNNNNGYNNGVNNGQNNGQNGSIYDQNNNNNGYNNGYNNGHSNPINNNNNNNGQPQPFRPQGSSLQIVDQFYDATYCWGTKDEQMEQALKGINSYNIMDVMKTWNLVHSTEKGESFMKAFMWDADSDQKEKYGKQIATALRDRALAAGVFEDCREDFAVIDQELRSWFFISNDISKNFDNIIAKIAEAENSANGKPYEQSEQTDGWHSTFRGTLA